MLQRFDMVANSLCLKIMMGHVQLCFSGPNHPGREAFRMQGAVASLRSLKVLGVFGASLMKSVLYRVTFRRLRGREREISR